MSRVIGVLEALGYAEFCGKWALTKEENAFMKMAAKKKGCLLKREELTNEEIYRVMKLGEKCRRWEELNG